jgi:AraC-like DNA-binding protein
MFSYNEIPAPAALKVYFHKFWTINNINNAIAAETKYALPNGCFTIAFVTGSGITLQYKNYARAITHGIYFSGQIDKRLKITIQPHTKAIMAQLTPWCASLITDFSLNEWVNNIIDLKMLNGGLHQKFQNINYSDEQLLFAEFCKTLAEVTLTQNSAIIKNACAIFQYKPITAPLNMADVASQTGYSQRYIEKKFRTHIGIPPGDYYAIVRLRNVINEIDSPGNQLSLGHLAHKYGYFDQSHFIKAYFKVMDSLPKRFNSADYILPFNN